MNSFDRLLRRVLLDAADEDVEWNTPPKASKPIIEFRRLQMKNNDMEKYIAELSPELQEKARQCKDMDELNELLAENDVELSEDALAAAAGGECSDPKYSQGDKVDEYCPQCLMHAYYWDKTYDDGNRYYCNNSECIACQEHWLFKYSCGILVRIK